MMAIRKAIEKALLSFGIKAIESAKLARMTATMIGSHGAAEAFAHYALHFEELSSDQELRDFMAFYAEHLSQSSSQWSQDIFALYTKRSKGRGSFLEIGGADGYTHSNTYMLEKKQFWSGTLIEPDPDQYALLKKIRKDCNKLNVAISPHGRQEHLELRRVGQLSSLRGHEGKDVHEETRLSHTKFKTVKAINISDLLYRTQYDYFSLDVEGAELSILKNIDWKNIKKPSSITVEHNYLQDRGQEITELLSSNGYIEFLPQHEWLRRGDIWAVLATSEQA